MLHIEFREFICQNMPKTVMQLLFCRDQMTSRSFTKKEWFLSRTKYEPFFFCFGDCVVLYWRRLLLVVSRERATYPLQISSKYTLSAVIAISSHIQACVPFKHIFIKVVPVLDNSSVIDGKTFKLW